MIRILPIIVAVLPLALLLTGCGSSGPRMYKVTGKVSYQGDPLPLGIIMFVAKEGPPSQPVGIGPDGRYELMAVAGEHTVVVVAVPPAQGSPDPEEEGGIDYSDAPPATSLIPEKYNRQETSGFTVVVERRKVNKIVIDLK